jgi:antitoxin HicB
MTVKQYPIVVIPLESEDGTGFVAYAPDLNGCMSDGESAEEALTNVGHAIQEWIDVAQRHGRPIPEPGSAIRNAAETRAHLAKELAEQRAAFERLDSQINEVEKTIRAISERLENEPPVWRPDVLLLSAKQQRSEDIVH